MIALFTMSVELEASGPVSHPTSPRSRRSRGVQLDARVTRIVPGFDAPFFQAGLAGYSDGAMRLVARRHGCPYCVTEALLDRTLINGGKGRRKEDPDLLEREARPAISDQPAHEARSLRNRRSGGEPKAAAGLDDHPIAGQIMGTHPA